jgi:hypothetical protein
MIRGYCRIPKWRVLPPSLGHAPARAPVRGRWDESDWPAGHFGATEGAAIWDGTSGSGHRPGGATGNDENVGDAPLNAKRKASIPFGR